MVTRIASAVASFSGCHGSAGATDLVLLLLSLIIFLYWDLANSSFSLARFFLVNEYPSFAVQTYFA